MDKLRSFFWKHFGITLDRETRLVIGVGSLSTLLAVAFGILFAITHSSFFLFLVVIVFIPVGALLMGSNYHAALWGVSSKEERKKIEEEIALKQLKRRARDQHFQH